MAHSCANYGEVTYTGLYPGIDAVFYGNRQRIEHDFIVSAGADYRQIRLSLSRSAHASIGRDGTLAITLKSGSLKMLKPAIYQEIDNKKIERSGSFRLLASRDISFEITGYDRRYALIIDPVLVFSTYQSALSPDASLVATDAVGNNYVVGYASVGYPVTAGAFSGCSSCTINNVATFVSKLSPDGASLIYSTVLGGNSYAQPTGMAIDANGNTIVSGWTDATDFPTKSGQPIATQNNNDVGFLFSLSADGSSLNYGTLLGSSPTSGLSTMTYATAVAVDPAGNAYVTGDTGNGFPTTAGALNQGGGGNSGNDSNVYVAKFSPTGGLLYSAVIGAADPQNGGAGPIGASAITVDAAGDAFVAGQAGILWPISSNAYLKQIAGSMPYATPFVTKVAPDARSLVYSTYLDYAYVVTGLAVLPNGNVFVAGYGAEPNYPTSPDAYQKSSSLGNEAFLTEVNSDGSGLVYATVIGDSTYSINGLALDPVNGDIWLAGKTENSAFPLLTPLQSTVPQASGFASPVSVVIEFDPSGKILEFSTFIGGIAPGYASAVAVDTNHQAHAVGAAEYGMYTTPGVYEPSVPAPGQGFAESTYAYVVLIDPITPAPSACVNPNTTLFFPAITVGTSSDETVTVASCGTEPLSITGIATAATVFTVPTSKNGCAQQTPVGQSCTFSVRYSPQAVESDTSTLTIQSNASIPLSVIGLSGSGVGPAFTIGTQPGGSTSSTVTAGQPASYALSITPAINYSGMVSFSCGGLPRNASCSFSPSNLILTGGTSANVTVTIATQSQAFALLGNGHFGTNLAYALILLPFISRRRRARVYGLMMLALLLLLVGLSACGGGGSSNSGNGGSRSMMVAPGTYSIQLTVSDGPNSQTQALTLVVQ